MIDWNKPLRTKEDQRPVYLIGVSSRGVHFVEDRMGSCWLSTDEGESNGGFRFHNLENVPERIQRFANVYGKIGGTGALFNSRTQCDTAATRGNDARTSVLELVFEGGQVVEAIIHKV